MTCLYVRERRNPSLCTSWLEISIFTPPDESIPKFVGSVIVVIPSPLKAELPLARVPEALFMKYRNCCHDWILLLPLYTGGRSHLDPNARARYLPFDFAPLRSGAFAVARTSYHVVETGDGDPDASDRDDRAEVGDGLRGAMQSRRRARAL